VCCCPCKASFAKTDSHPRVFVPHPCGPVPFLDSGHPALRPSCRLRCSRRSCGAVLVQRKGTKIRTPRQQCPPGILPCGCVNAGRGSPTALLRRPRTRARPVRALAGCSVLLSPPLMGTRAAARSCAPKPSRAEPSKTEQSKVMRSVRRDRRRVGRSGAKALMDGEAHDRESHRARRSAIVVRRSTKSVAVEAVPTRRVSFCRSGFSRDVLRQSRCIETRWDSRSCVAVSIGCIRAAASHPTMVEGHRD
jgi:hypothetical protein